MADPLTPNVGLAVPIRGTDVGTWDVPVNGDFTLIDSMMGGVTTVALASSPVTLATSQAQSAIITLTGTLNANVSITLPSIYKVWTIHNQLTNSPSSFCATLVSTSGTSIIGLPPSTQDVFYDGITLRYKQLGKIGEYWDYAGAVVPSWVTASTIPPYLNCNGTSFSSAVYPVLANLLGTNVLPDVRGVPRIALNQGTNRVTTAGSGLDGNTIFSLKTIQTATLINANLPSYTPSGSISVGTNNGNPFTPIYAGGAGTNPFSAIGGAAYGGLPTTISAAFTGNNNGGISQPFGLVATGIISGITMIRA